MESTTLINQSALKFRPAAGRFSAVPRPFLRWAGSKQALLGYLSERLPETYGRYYEPFLGSGALFFHLKPKLATLSDVSLELINVWRAVKSSSEDLIKYLRPLSPDRDLFYQIRSQRSADPITRSGEFLYLNKTCWNGLYRVNSKGEFNVPYGAPRTDFIVDEENLRACSALLARRSVSIRHCDFADSLSHARGGDLVYLDPPYVTKHNFNGFRDYNEKLFKWDDQVRLAKTAQRLKDRGVFVIVSNANHPDVMDLYRDFSVYGLDRSSTLSGNKAYRGKVSEVIITANL